MNLGYMFLKWSSLHQSYQTDVRCYHIHICYLSLSNIPPFSSRQNISKKKKNAKHCSIEDILKGKEQQDSLSTNF